MSYRCEILTSKIKMVVTNKYQPDELLETFGGKYEEGQTRKVEPSVRYSGFLTDLYFYEFIVNGDNGRYVCISARGYGSVFNLSGDSRIYIFSTPIDPYEWPEGDDPSSTMSWLSAGLQDVESEGYFAEVEAVDGLSILEKFKIEEQVKGRSEEIAMDIFLLIRQWSKGLEDGEYKKPDRGDPYSFHTGLEDSENWKERVGSKKDEVYYDNDVYAWYATRVMNNLFPKPFPRLRIDWEAYFEISHWAVMYRLNSGVDYWAAKEEFSEVVPIKPQKYVHSWYEHCEDFQKPECESPLCWPDGIVYRFIKESRYVAEGAYAATKVLNLPFEIEEGLASEVPKQWTISLGESFEEYLSQERAMTLDDEGAGDLKRVCETLQSIMTKHVLPSHLFRRSFEYGLVKAWQVCKRVEKFVDQRVAGSRESEVLS